ncbi:unnamed protein product, partial [Polarella glacialis]
NVNGHAPRMPQEPLARRPRRVLTKDARPYQLQVDFFFDRAEAATAEGKHLNFQMACGTGKTFTYGLIIARDLQQFPEGRHVVFVPWQDLARQTEAELKSFGLEVCVMGAGSNKLNRKAHVVVCVYASAFKLLGMSFRTKIVDEAHHMELKTTGPWASRMGGRIPAEMVAHFSGTFHQQSSVDFRYDLDLAVKEGYVCDFQITVAVTPNDDDDVEGMAKWLVANSEQFSPMLVVCNRIEKAWAFSALLSDLGLRAACIDGRATGGLRNMAKNSLDDGSLQALC